MRNTPGILNLHKTKLLSTVTCRSGLILLLCLYHLTTLAAVEVKIEGIQDEALQNVQLLLGVEQYKNHPQLQKGRIFRLHDKAEAEIRQALQPFGYYKPTITSELTQTHSGDWLAHYKIDKGQAIPIHSFDFTLSESLQNDEAFSKLINTFNLQSGAAFVHREYEVIKSSLAQLALERGYFDARFIVNRVEIDLTQYHANIMLQYEGGKRYVFGKINVQQDILKSELLNAYLPFASGDPYSLHKVLELQQASTLR